MQLLNKKILKKFFRPGLFLVLLFLLVVAYEVYLLKTHVYRDVTETFDAVGSDKIVRLNFNSYTNAINVLGSLQNFTPTTWHLKNPNPFK